MTEQQFWKRFDQISEEMEEKNDGCFVYVCKDCGHEGAWYEGRVEYLFKRVNDPCDTCGSTNKELTIGLGERYEL